VGASTFEQYADGAEVAAAFRTARADADVEHGDGGYSGSLAEKHDYVVITRQAMDRDDAYRLARDLITRQDPRIDDKWGPAGAIPVRTRTRTAVVDDLSGTGTGGDLSADTLADIAQIARQRGLISDGETVIAGRLRSCTTPGSVARGEPHQAGATTYRDGIAELTVAKAPDAFAAQTRPDGWLFFGWSST
jgi:hypothetical protein